MSGVRPRLPEVLRNRDFDLYWGGVVLSQVGALTLGGLVPIVAAAGTALGGRTVRRYTISGPEAAPA